jgi:hypothetical protein
MLETMVFRLIFSSVLEFLEVECASPSLPPVESDADADVEMVYVFDVIAIFRPERGWLKMYNIYG